MVLKKKSKRFFFFLSHDHLNYMIVNLLNENQIKLYNPQEEIANDIMPLWSKPRENLVLLREIWSTPIIYLVLFIHREGSM